MAIVSTTVVTNELVAGQRRVTWRVESDSGDVRFYGPAFGPENWDPEDDNARVAGIIQDGLVAAELDELLES